MFTLNTEHDKSYQFPIECSKKATEYRSQRENIIWKQHKQVIKNQNIPRFKPKANRKPQNKKMESTKMNKCEKGYTYGYITPLQGDGW